MKRTAFHIVFALGLALIFSCCMTAAELRAERINNNQAIYLQLVQFDNSCVSRIQQF